MKIIIKKNYEEMSKTTAKLFVDFINQNVNKEQLNISITAGQTPLKMYEILIDQYAKEINSKNIKYFNFDEIPFKSNKKFGITIRDLNNTFFKPGNIDIQKIHHLNSLNYTTHDEYLKNIGDLDLVLLGIGADGHYCGNLPNTTSFDDWTVKVPVDEKLSIRISRLFDDKNEIPNHYITMGPRSIMNAKKIVLIANGKHKAEIIKTLLDLKLDKDIPASILPLHPDLTIILDEDAGSLIK